LIALLFLGMAQGCALRAQVVLQPAQVDQLVAPIALYPDPLLALILPASAAPSDIAAAAIYLRDNGDPAQVDSQPWDDSVRGLAHYPEVVIWMAQNFAWTQTLGAAFLAQPADVIQSVQRLRAEARASGALMSSPEEEVIMDPDGNIEIEPAQGDVIYVPRYDPDVVYAGGVYDFGAGPCIFYGSPYPIGIWLTFGFDWNNGVVCVGDWNTWHDSHGWRHPRAGSLGHGNIRRWSPAPGRPRPDPRALGGGAFQAARPALMRGVPPAPARNAVRVPQGNRQPGSAAPPAAPAGDYRSGVPAIRPGPELSGQKPASAASSAQKPAPSASSDKKEGGGSPHLSRAAAPAPSPDRKDENSR
jgi:hypothetical protein